jgi:hypothetical protein
LSPPRGETLEDLKKLLPYGVTIRSNEHEIKYLFKEAMDTMLINIDPKTKNGHFVQEIKNT